MIFLHHWKMNYSHRYYDENFGDHKNIDDKIKISIDWFYVYAKYELEVTLHDNPTDKGIMASNQNG